MTLTQSQVLSECLASPIRPGCVQPLAEVVATSDGRFAVFARRSGRVVRDGMATLEAANRLAAESRRHQRSLAAAEAAQSKPVWNIR
jgi:hypothetical protein